MALVSGSIFQRKPLSGNVQGGARLLGEYAWEQPVLWNASKLQIPKEAHWWLRREKLLSGIEGGDEDAVVFHAGAGYGKTTVMAEWAMSHRAQSCWYRLHESDNHFYRFLYGIATALSGIVNASLFDADKMKLTGREKPEQVSELFFSKCIPALPAEGVSICLDDFQVIHDETVQDFLLRFMEYGEGRARFFFSSRGAFPGFLAACLMRGRAREIREEELKFEERETALFLNRMSGRELPRQVVQDIHAQTRGWPAGIAFAGLDLKNTRKPSASGYAVLFDRSRLYDYIFYEIFRKLAYDTQQFLLETSVFETMTPSLCNYAMGRSDAAGMLSYLMRENLFLFRIEGEAEVYYCDGVFKGFLKSRLPEGRSVVLLRKAAEYHVRHEEWETAVHYAMQCGETGCEIVAAVLEKRAAQMAASGQQALLRTWIDYLYDYRGRLQDTALYCMYEHLYQNGEHERAGALLSEAAKQAYGKLRYDSYERYMRELAALAQKEHGRAGAEKIEAGAREKLAARGILMKGWEICKEEILFVQCFGSLSVRGREGEALWRTKKTKELFACLFYEQGKWVTRDVLMERLWPEKTAEKAAVLLHTTTSYLRRALAGAGAAECLLVRNQSYALTMARVQSDMEIFSECYEWVKSGKALPKERADRLIAVYGRGYLYEEDYVWLGAYREEMEQRYLWMLQSLADRAFADGDYSEAVNMLKKLTEVDGYALDAMELLVECLVLCRDLTGAKRAYQRLADASREVLGEEPERAFEEFAGEARR